MSKLQTNLDSSVEPILLFLLTVATRLPFTSHFLFHIDSCQFALALNKYDVFLHQPQPPGYFLYVMLGKLLNNFIGDANRVFISISIVFSGLTVVAIYYLAKNLYDRKTGLLAAALAITSPNLWFHGEVALSYVLEAFFSTLVAFLCWRVINGRHGLVWILAVVLAVAGGIRQNTPVFLFPLWLYSMKSLPLGKILMSFFVFVLVSFSWFVPMILMTGGWERYVAALAEHREFVLANRSVFKGGLPVFFHYVSTISRFVIYGVGAGFTVLGMALYVAIRSGDVRVFNRQKACFFLVWMLPSILFYLFIFIHSGNPGYALIFLPCFLILTAISTIYIGSVLFNGFMNKFVPLLSAGMVTINGVFFLFFIHPVSYREIKDHNVNLPIVLQHIRILDPTKTAVFAQTYLNYSYRHIMCYLPEYYVINAPQKHSVEMRNTFAGFHGETLLDKKPVLPSSITKFAAVVIDPEEERNVQIAKELRQVEVRNVGTIFSGPIDLVGVVFPELLRLRL